MDGVGWKGEVFFWNGNEEKRKTEKRSNNKTHIQTKNPKPMRNLHTNSIPLHRKPSQRPVPRGEVVRHRRWWRRHRIGLASREGHVGDGAGAEVILVRRGGWWG